MTARGVTKAEALRNLIAALGFDPDDPKSASIIANLYTPDTRLPAMLAEVDKIVSTAADDELDEKVRQQLGYRLEEIVIVAFQGLTGASTLKSYLSAAAQHDLVIDGDDVPWLALCRALYLDRLGGTGILVEAKATADAVPDKEFQRLGNILTHYFKNTIGLGVFVAINGATGFPKPDGNRVHGLRDARLTQAIVYYGLKKPIIVLDWKDLKSLTTEGSLVRVMASRIRELEQMSGLFDPGPAAPAWVDVPERLEQFVSLPPSLDGTTPGAPRAAAAATLSAITTTAAAAPSPSYQPPEQEVLVAAEETTIATEPWAAAATPREPPEPAKDG